MGAHTEIDWAATGSMISAVGSILAVLAATAAAVIALLVHRQTDRTQRELAVNGYWRYYLEYYDRCLEILTRYEFDLTPAKTNSLSEADKRKIYLLSGLYLQLVDYARVAKDPRASWFTEQSKWLSGPFLSGQFNGDRCLDQNTWRKVTAVAQIHAAQAIVRADEFEPGTTVLQVAELAGV